MAGTAKLRASPDAVALFQLLGAEPWGRWLVGACESVTVLLLVWPRTVIGGAWMGVALMIGVLATHLFVIGIDYGGGPVHFILACMVLVACGSILWSHRATSAVR